MIQSYNKKPRFCKKMEISGYHLLILVLYQKELCAKLGMTPAYSKHLRMFEEYLDIQSVCKKKTYAYARLAEKYGMHTSSVRRVISSMSQTVSIGA